MIPSPQGSQDSIVTWTDLLDARTLPELHKASLGNLLADLPDGCGEGALMVQPTTCWSRFETFSSICRREGRTPSFQLLVQGYRTLDRSLTTIWLAYPVSVELVLAHNRTDPGPRSFFSRTSLNDPAFATYNANDTGLWLALKPEQIRQSPSLEEVRRYGQQAIPGIRPRLRPGGTRR